MSQRTLSVEDFQRQRVAAPQPRLKLFGGNGNPALAQQIAAALDVPLAEMSIFRYADGEIGVRIE